MILTSGGSSSPNQGERGPPVIMFLGENVLKICSSDNVWKGQVRCEKVCFDPLNSRGSEGVLKRLYIYGWFLRS